MFWLKRSRLTSKTSSVTAGITSSLRCVCNRPCRLQDTPVSVYALHPGAVDTPLSRQLLPPVVTHVIFALASWLQVLKDPDQVGRTAQPTSLPALSASPCV